MENLDKKQCVCCAGGSCGGMSSMSGCGCHGGKHHLIKIILKLIIVIIIFSCGFKLGVITGSIRAGYGHGIIGGNNSGMMYR